MVAVACFLPGQAKDISAPPRTQSANHEIKYKNGTKILVLSTSEQYLVQNMSLSPYRMQAEEVLWLGHIFPFSPSFLLPPPTQSSTPIHPTSLSVSKQFDLKRMILTDVSLNYLTFTHDLKYTYTMKIMVGQSNQKTKAVYNQTQEISAYY
jgi:hypothetical protein